MPRPARSLSSTQLVYILVMGTAMMFLCVLSTLMLRIRADAQEAEAVYIRQRVDTLEGRLRDDLLELHRVALQAQQAAVFQDFLTQQDPYEKFKLHSQAADIWDVLMKYNGRITVAHLFTARGDCYSFPESMQFSAWMEIRRGYDWSDIASIPSQFRLVDSRGAGEYDRFQYITPFRDANLYETLALLVIEGSMTGYRTLLSDPYLSLCVSDAQGHAYPPGSAVALEARAMLRELPFGASFRYAQQSPVISPSLQDYARYLYVTLLVTMSMLVFSALWMKRRLAQPMASLARQLDEVGKAARSHVDPPRGTQETAVLSEHINALLDTLARQRETALSAQEQMYESELQRRAMQFYALQNQVNPHFLYNTLQCIRGIALYRDVPEIARVSTSLSEILRHALQGDQETSLRREVDIARKFMEIMNIRSMNRYALEVQIPEEELDRPVCRMCIQPLVENAVLHGLHNVESHARIAIACEREGACIKLTVRDNGQGFDREELAHVLTHMELPLQKGDPARNIGLRNLQQRIRTLYGERYGVNIVSVPGETIVTLTLPLRKACDAKA